MTSLQIVFLVVAAVTLFSAGMVVSARKLMHAALFLVLTLMGVAFMFAMLGSGFFAVIQVLVYIGSIAILIIFAVMLTRNMMDSEAEASNRGWQILAPLSLLIFAGIITILSSWHAFTSVRDLSGTAGEDVVALGKALTDPNGFAIPFELASILLVAALAGAIYVAMERKGGRG
ncbi:MAG: NADH-quinone oxidoreductase subunit J [Anaerolineaceae bacterium]|nr:NADH-quinone oxidoreductase subunit J [Anaerolineaceae bacterium]